MRKGLQALTALICIAGFGGSAQALSIDITIIEAAWVNVLGGGNTLTGVGTDWIKWGKGTAAGGYQKSGYRFDTDGYAPTTVNTDTAFELGEFTHYNYPVTGNTIRRAELQISASLSIDGQSLQSDPFSFRFRHNETSNSCSPQPRCARDVVRLSASENSDGFLVNGIEYTMDLIGFMDDLGNIRRVFRTLENSTNSADLLAIFKATGRPVISSTNSVSLTEPGLIGLLLIGGLTTLAWRRRGTTE